MKIAIIGLGYVGLPLSLQFARSGVRVIGLDIESHKIRLLERGKSYIRHVAPEVISSAIRDKTFSVSTDFRRIREAEAVIICVPTPLTKNREPDISCVLRSGEAIAANLKTGMLVVLESTTYPGTTDEDLRSVLERGAGMRAGQDFHLAFSPEREDPGNPHSKVNEIPKIVGGLTPACCERARALYARAIKSVVPVSSCRVAEAAKLLENTFRAVNIGLVNELKAIYSAMGIDIWEVIAAAKTKPFGFMPFYPGPGVGGHCIPIDPIYLTWKAREYGKSARFIELATEINAGMPEYVVRRVSEALNAQCKPLKGARILLLGLAYKANIDDFRESPTVALMNLLKDRGVMVEYYDPFIPKMSHMREANDWRGKKSIKWSQKCISAFDTVVISTAHEEIDYRELAQWAKSIVDTRNAMAGIKMKACQIWKA